MGIPRNSQSEFTVKIHTFIPRNSKSHFARVAWMMINYACGLLEKNGGHVETIKLIVALKWEDDDHHHDVTS